MDSLKTQLEKARLELSRAESARKARFADTEDTRYGKLDPEYKKQALAKLKTAATKVQAAQKRYDQLKLAFDKEQEIKGITGEQDGIPEDVQAANQGLTVEQLRAKKAADLEADKERRIREARAAGAPVNTGNVPIEDFLKNLDAASTDTINQIKADLGIKNLDGKLDYETIIAIYGKEKEIETVADATGRPVDRLTYYKTAPKTGAGEVVPTATISSPTAASSIINTVFQAELGRDATASEIEKYTLRLNAAERKNPSKTVKGITTGGLNKTEFLTQIVKKLPEYSTKKTDTRSLSVQTLQSTARANGVSLSPEQLNQYALDIQNGKDIKVIQSQIRNIAGLGMPDNVKKLLAEGTDLDTVYAPYKSQMAAILEVNPQTINFTDPALRSAIGPNGEMPIYDFQRALRKDARWQYTNNAREDVFDSVSKVLQDFGFQG